LIVFLALVSRKLEDPDFIQSYSLLFSPIWVGAALHSFAEYRFAVELASRGVNDAQNPSSKALSAVSSNFEFWQCLLLVSKLNGSSSLAWEATFLPIWFFVGLFYVFCFLLFIYAVRSIFACRPQSRELQPALRLFVLSLLTIMTAIAVSLTFLLIRMASRLEGEKVCVDIRSGEDNELMGTKCDFKYSFLDMFLPSIVGSCIIDLTLLSLCVGIYCLRRPLWQIVLAYQLRLHNTYGPGLATVEDPQMSLDAMLELPRPAMLQKLSSTYFRDLKASQEVAPDPASLPPQARPPMDTTGVSSGIDAEIAAMEEGRSSNVASEDQHCYICMDNVHNAVFMPCGHGGICYECAIDAWKKKQTRCPQCRQTITQVLQLGATHKREDGSEFVAVIARSQDSKEQC